MEDVGRRLRERRQALGLDLKAAQEATRIRLRYLQALEAGDTSVFPGDVYLKGYLRSYCEFLGLDPKTMIEDFERERHGGAAPSPSLASLETVGSHPGVPPPVPGPEPSATPSTPRRRRAGRRAGRYGLAGPDPLGMRRTRLWWTGIVAILAVVAATWYWTSDLPSRTADSAGPGPGSGSQPAASDGAGHPGTDGRAGASEPSPSEPATSEGSRPATVVDRSIASDGAILYTVARADTLTVHVTFTGDCWVLANADGVQVGRGRTYHAGEEAEWTASQRLSLIVGYPPALHLTVNGLDEGVLDAAKRVRYVRVVAASVPSS